MKSKVIVFCVWLFCSQFVESNPFAEDHVRKRVHQPANWPDISNIPRHIHNRGFTQTQNGNENFQNDFSNQGRQYDTYENNNPTPLTPGKEEMLVDSYSPRAENYPSRVIDEPQPILHNRHHRKPNWQLQNQFGHSLSSGDGITDHETRESNRGLGQYPPTQYIPTEIRQHHHTNTNHPLRTDQYPMVNSDSNRFLVNSASQLKFGNKAPSIPGGNRFRDVSTFQGPTKTAPLQIFNGPAITDSALDNFEKIRPVKSYELHSGSINPVPTDDFKEQSSILTNKWGKKSGRNSGYVNNFGLHSGSINTAPVQQYNDGASIISGNLAGDIDNSKYVDYRSGSSDTAHPNTAEISDVLTENLGKNKYLDSYDSNSGFNNFAPINKNIGATEAVPTTSDNTGDSKYLDSVGSDYRKIDIIPANTAPISEDLSENSRKSQYTDTYGTDSKSSKNEPVTSYDVNPAITSDNLSKNTENSWYEDNYGSDFGLSKNGADEYNRAPEIIAHKLTENIENSKQVDNYGYDIGLSDNAPVNNNNADTLTDSLTKYSGTNRYADSDKYNYGHSAQPTYTENFENSKYIEHSGLDKPAATDNLNQGLNIYHQFSKRQGNIDFEEIVSNPVLRDLLLNNKARYLVIKPDGTFQYLDELLPSMQNNLKYHHLRTKDNDQEGLKDQNDSTSNIAYITESPAYIPSNSESKSPDSEVPVYEQTISPNGNAPENYNNPKISQSDYNPSPTTLSSIELDDYTSSTPLITNKPDDILSPVVLNDTDYNPIESTTSPPIVPDYNTSPTPLFQNTTDTNETPVSIASDLPTVTTTTPCTDDASADDIITSPIELQTDNVTDVSLVTSTIANLVNVSDTYDAITQDKQDEASDETDSSLKDTSILDKDQNNSTTTVAPSTSASTVDNRDEIITNENSSQSIDTIITDQTNDVKNVTKIATNSSLSNTDVPAKHDDYSPYTTDSTVQTDVHIGDTSSTPGDNPLESTEPTNDLIITLNTTSDSDDDTITIIIEVSESTDDADSSSDEKKIVVNIDAQDSSGDDSKTTNKEEGDCKKDQTTNTDDTDKGKNLEIDLKNIKDEPTVWFKTTDEEFIDKLTSSSESKFDIIYFFKMQPQVQVERETKTTIYCNGTIITETIETTWQYKDDPSPKVEKQSKIIKP